ncbi:MAG: hypothetical protein KBS98_04745 [Flavobacterium sp.]|nr:hypothetical protein [Candidatus Neoflavobacterium equi]
MKKKLEAELISIAHRVLKIHNRLEIEQLQQEALNLYEKLSILRFYEENFEPSKPTLSKGALEIALENHEFNAATAVGVEETLTEENNEDNPQVASLFEETAADNSLELEKTVATTLEDEVEVIQEDTVEVALEENVEVADEDTLEDTLENKVEVADEDTLEKDVEVADEDTLEEDVEVADEDTLEEDVVVADEVTLEKDVEVTDEDTLEDVVEVADEDTFDDTLEEEVEVIEEATVEVADEDTVEDEAEVAVEDTFEDEAEVADEDTFEAHVEVANEDILEVADEDTFEAHIEVEETVEADVESIIEESNDLISRLDQDQNTAETALTFGEEIGHLAVQEEEVEEELIPESSPVFLEFNESDKPKTETQTTTSFGYFDNLTTDAAPEAQHEVIETAVEETIFEEEIAAEAPSFIETPEKIDQKTQETNAFFDNLFAGLDDTPVQEEKPQAVQISFEELLGQGYHEPEFVKVQETVTETEIPVAEQTPTQEVIEDTTEETLETPIAPVEVVKTSILERAFSSFHTFGDKKEEPKNHSLNDSLNKTISLSLNDRIAFERNLFNGSAEDLNRVISSLNSLHTWAEAEDFIFNLIKPDYNNWAGQEEYEARFLELVEKKFS